MSDHYHPDLERDVQYSEQDIRALKDEVASLRRELDEHVRAIWAHVGKMPGGI